MVTWVRKRRNCSSERGHLGNRDSPHSSPLRPSILSSSSSGGDSDAVSHSSSGESNIGTRVCGVRACAPAPPRPRASGYPAGGHTRPWCSFLPGFVSFLVSDWCGVAVASLLGRARGHIGRLSAGLVSELLHEVLEEAAGLVRIGCRIFCQRVRATSRTLCGIGYTCGLALTQRLARIPAVAQILDGAVDPADSAVECWTTEELSWWHG